MSFRLATLVIAIVCIALTKHSGAQELFFCKIENQESKMIQTTTPEYLYKVVSPEQWQKSLQQKKVVGSSIDEEFIHLAKEDQVQHVVHKFWNGIDYVILKLDSKKLVGRLVYETNTGRSTQYYHLYEGEIPLNAVVDACKINQ